MPNTMPTILLVEDDSSARELTSLVLEDAGYRVLEASGADEALSLLRDHREIDLVFSDIQMPGRMNGIGLARHVLQHKLDLPVLLTSGKPANYYADYPGDTKFLSKPYDRSALLRWIASCLGQH
jgi:CheY-like chemotaxis protein